MSQITVGKVIIDFPDSHKDIAEGLKDAITEELSDKSSEDSWVCIDKLSKKEKLALLRSK
jgi:hypothetical protein